MRMQQGQGSAVAEGGPASTEACASGFDEAATAGSVTRRPIADFIPILGGCWIALCGVLIPHDHGAYFYGVNRSLWSGEFPYELVPVVLFVTAAHLAALIDRHPRRRRTLAWWATVGWVAVTAIMFGLGIPLGAGLTAMLTLRSSAAYLDEAGAIRRRNGVGYRIRD